ncbi:MAG: hydrolase [Pedosphaera sp.]|nr:hydrolase [Pedosphaera sp.]
MVRLVLFDIDGTLIRTGGAGTDSFGRVADVIFQKPGAMARINFHGRTDTSIVREFFRNEGIPYKPSNLNRYFDAYTFLLDHRLTGNAGEMLPGVRQFIADLRALPKPPLIALLTGNIRLGAEIKLRAHDLWGEFITGAFGDDHESRNQLAQIAWDRGTRVLGERPDADEIVVIGDTPLDIACGESIKARTLAVATGGFSVRELKSHEPTWAVPDLTQISAEKVCE